MRFILHVCILATAAAASQPGGTSVLAQIYGAAAERAVERMQELTSSLSGATGGLAAFARSLIASDESLARSVPAAAPRAVIPPIEHPSTSLHDLSMLAAPRRLQSIVNASICSGVGVLVPLSGNGSTYSCGGQPVSSTVFNAIALVQSSGGDTASIATLTAALLSSNVSFPALLSPATRRSTLNLTLAQRTVVNTLTPVSLNASAGAVNVSVLFPSQQATPVSLALLAVIGGPATAALLNDTTCSVGSSGGTGASVCVCPLDYTGEACATPRHYACTVMMSDAGYHACLASNSRGFKFNGGGCTPTVAAMSDVAEAGKRVGIASTDTTAGSFSIPRPSDTSSFKSYSTLTSGDPPCLFFSPAACGGMPLTLRVSCAFLDVNVTSVTSPGQVLVDSSGKPYLARARAPRNTTAGLAIAYLPPYIPTSSATLPSTLTCNGSDLNAAFLAQAGVNTSTTAALPPWYGLPCVERSFRYAVGTPETPWFALSSPPALPLAVVGRALPSVYISDRTGTAIAPLPTAALNGSVDVTLTMPAASALAGDAGYWVAGRLYTELKVAQVPEASFPGFTAASAAALLQLDTVARGVSDEARMRTVTTPLLLLSNVYRVIVDDASYVEPTGRDMRPIIVGVVLGLGLPIVMAAAGALWWRSRAQRRKEEAELQQAVTRRAQLETSQRDDRAERELLQALATHEVPPPPPPRDEDAAHRAAFVPVSDALNGSMSRHSNGLRQREVRDS